MTQLDGALRLAIAALVGLGVGVEREWTINASGRPPRFAGLRTFSMLGLLGGCAGLLMTTLMLIRPALGEVEEIQPIP